jgi:hypothetical protein
MVKAGPNKKQKRKPSKNKQYERFQKAARDLDVDDEKTAVAFEDSFRKIVPPRARRQK